MEGFEFDLRFLRPKKAEWTKKWYKTFSIKEDIGYSEYDDAVILPLKTFPGDNLLFGRGG